MLLEQTTFTTEQLLAMPDDCVERWLVDGELREKPWRVRGYREGRISAVLCHALEDWNRQQQSAQGEVAAGNVGFRLTRQPDTTLGTDVAYVSPEVARIADETMLYAGPPLLAVEILSSNDTLQEMHEKVRKYHE